MRYAKTQLFLAGAVLIVCIGLAVAALDAGKSAAAVVALIACLVSCYLLLCADERMQDALDDKALEHGDGQFMN